LTKSCNKSKKTRDLKKLPMLNVYYYIYWEKELIMNKLHIYVYIQNCVEFIHLKINIFCNLSENFEMSDILKYDTDWFLSTFLTNIIIWMIKKITVGVFYMATWIINSFELYQYIDKKTTENTYWLFWHGHPINYIE